MKRFKKAALLILRRMAYRANVTRMYYWAEDALFELRAVHLMPRCYYRWLFQACMRLIKSQQFRRVADRVIHSIPYHIRFEVA